MFRDCSLQQLVKTKLMYEIVYISRYLHLKHRLHMVSLDNINSDNNFIISHYAKSLNITCIKMMKARNINLQHLSRFVSVNEKLTQHP